MAAASASFDDDDQTKFWEMRKLVKKLDSYKGYFIDLKSF